MTNEQTGKVIEALTKALERMCLVVDAHAGREGLSRHYAAEDGPIGQARAALSLAKVTSDMTEWQPNEEDEDAFAEIAENEFFDEECMHTMQVSISETECQCTGCLRIWPKPEGFVSDIPWQDRG